MALQLRTQEALLQLLLSAAQDEWQQVSAPARAWLKKQAEAAAAASLAAAAPPAAPSAFAAASERLLLQLLEGLPGALRSGDAAGRQHAQQLTSAVQAGSERQLDRWQSHCAHKVHCWGGMGTRSGLNVPFVSCWLRPL